MARLKYIISLGFVLAALLSGLFYSCNWEARRQKASAEIEAVQATTDYQIEYARQLARCKR